MTNQPHDREWMTREELFRDHRDVGGLKEWFYDWHGLNEWLFLQINGLRGHSYDQLMLFITQFGSYKNFHWWMLAITMFAGLSLLYRKLMKKGGLRAHAVMWLGVLVVLVVGFAANGLMVRTVKDHFSYPRPYVALEADQVQQIQPQEADDALRSFPSGHMAFITFLMVSLWPVAPENRKWLLMVPIALIGWSRVSLGVHFPADVMWSLLLTGTLIVLVRRACYSLLFRLFGLAC